MLSDEDNVKTRYRQGKLEITGQGTRIKANQESFPIKGGIFIWKVEFLAIRLLQAVLSLPELVYGKRYNTVTALGATTTSLGRAPE